MIKLLLLYPLIAALFLLLLNNKFWNKLLVLLYALLGLVLSWRLLSLPEQPLRYLQTDGLNVYFLLVIMLVFAGVAVYNLDFCGHLNLTRRKHTYYSISLLMFVFCMVGIILSQHLALLWVFVEAATLCTAYLIYFDNSHASLEATWKYIFICSIAIALAFIGIIFLSLAAGTVNSLFFTDLYLIAGHLDVFWLKIAWPFLLVGFGTKIGLAPVHSWLPDAYSEAPSPVSALLSGALSNTIFLALIRLFRLYKLAGLVFYAQTLLLVMAFASLLIAAVFVVRSHNFKRLLAYSSIENTGLMVLGLALGGIGMLAALWHMLAHALIKTIMFLTGGNVVRRYDSKEIADIRGLWHTDPRSAWIWVFGCLALLGFPLSPLFFSKLWLIQTLIIQERWLLLASLLVLLLIIAFGLSKAFLSMVGGQPEKQLAEKQTYLWLRYWPQYCYFGLLAIASFYLPPKLFLLIQHAVLNS